MFIPPRIWARAISGARAHGPRHCMPTLLAGKLKSSGLAFIFGVVARRAWLKTSRLMVEIWMIFKHHGKPSWTIDWTIFNHWCFFEIWFAHSKVPSGLLQGLWILPRRCRFQVLLYPRNIAGGLFTNVFLCWFCFLANWRTGVEPKNHRSSEWSAGPAGGRQEQLYKID